ncbi:MAG: DoxX family protein [Verrucomicrobiota bacterium]
MPFYLVLFSAVSFLGFGSACLLSSYMKQEFARYGLARFRVMTGTLQLFGALGLLAGLEVPWIGRFSAAGLALMMLLGVGVRLKIRDSLRQTTPAFFYMALNAYLCLSTVWIR